MRMPLGKADKNLAIREEDAMAANKITVQKVLPQHRSAET